MHTVALIQKLIIGYPNLNFLV